MTVLRHMMATDVRRYWPLMAGYAAMVIADTIVDASQPAAALNATAGPLMALAAGLTGIAKLLLSAVLVGSVVHAHGLVGSDAFWMTRPISRRTLLLSKLLPLAVLVVGLPVVCELVFMTFYAVPLGVMTRVALQSALFQASWLALLMSGAVLTSNLAGLALLGGAAVAALAVMFAASTAWLLSTLNDDGMAFVAVGVNQIGPAGDDPTGAAVGLVLLPAVAVAVMAIQYQTRLRRRAILVGGIGFAVTCLLSTYWPWPVLQATVEPADWAARLQEGTLTARPDTVTYQPAANWLGRRSRWRPVVASVAIDNIEAGWRAQARLVGASIDQGGGQVFTSAGMRYSQGLDYAPTEEHIQAASVRRLLQVTRLAGAYRTTDPETIVLLVPEPPVAPPAGLYTGTFAVELTRQEIAAVLPLRAGASYQHGAERLVVDAVRVHPGFVLGVRRSNATTIFDRRPASTYEFYFRNARAGEAIVANASPAVGEASLFFSGLNFEAMFGFGAAQYFVIPSGDIRDGVRADEVWLKDAELVIVRVTERAPVVRTLRIENFRVGER